jgi:hypothetical protein
MPLVEGNGFLDACIRGRVVTRTSKQPAVRPNNNAQFGSFQGAILVCANMVQKVALPARARWPWPWRCESSVWALSCSSYVFR